MAKQRSTVYNAIFSDVKEWENVNRSNVKLVREFLNFCASSNRSPNTIYQYKEQLKIFFIWNSKENLNKIFYDIRRRDFVNFFGYGRSEMGWSSSRLASFRSVLSSLSNYVEVYMDDERPDFHNQIKALEPVHVTPVREKTVLNDQQIDQALKSLVEAGDIQEACWLSLLFSSGMRKAEALQMKVSFFKPENIVFDIMYKTPKIRTKGRGKEGKQVPRYVFAYTFQPYLDLWLEKRAELGITNEDLFVKKKGGEYIPATISTFNSWAQKIGTILNVDFYAHGVRHAWTTRLKKDGYPDNIVQKLQNWANVDMVALYNDTGDEEELENFFKNK